MPDVYECNMILVQEENLGYFDMSMALHSVVPFLLTWNTWMAIHSEMNCPYLLFLCSDFALDHIYFLHCKVFAGLRCKIYSLATNKSVNTERSPVLGTCAVPS